MQSYSSLPRIDELYRFRSVDSLVGKFKELYYQTIYLANPYELNDLSETTTAVQWRGDRIVRSKFIDYYWISLMFRESGAGGVVLPGYHVFPREPFTESKFVAYVAKMNDSYAKLKETSIKKLIATDVKQILRCDFGSAFRDARMDVAY